MNRQELLEELEVAYIGRDTARDEDEVRYFEGEIERLENEESQLERTLRGAVGVEYYRMIGAL